MVTKKGTPINNTSQMCIISLIKIHLEQNLLISFNNFFNSFTPNFFSLFFTKIWNSKRNILWASKRIDINTYKDTSKIYNT
jgi:hypothetical protein